MILDVFNNESATTFTTMLTTLAMFLPMLVVAFTVHELSHGLAAYSLGDTTAKRQGRLTLNPLRHIDPIGFLCILVIGFGWAKPVMVNPYNLKNPKVDFALIAAAGPISNFLLAFIGALLLMLFANNTLFIINGEITYFSFAFVDGELQRITLSPLIQASLFFIQINLVLGIFNLIPIPPLDGSKIIAGILPQETLNRLPDISRYSLIILLALVMPIVGGQSIIQLVIFPIVQGLLVLFLSFGQFLFA